MGDIAVKGGNAGVPTQVGLMDAVKVGETNAETKQQKNFLSGVNLSIGRVNVAANSMSATALINFINTYFETLKTTAENLGVNKEQQEKNEERIEKLRKLQDQLKDQEIELEDAVAQLNEIMRDSMDAQLLEKMMNEAKGANGFA